MSLIYSSVSTNFDNTPDGNIFEKDIKDVEVNFGDDYISDSSHKGSVFLLSWDLPLINP